MRAVEAGEAYNSDYVHCTFLPARSINRKLDSTIGERAFLSLELLRFNFQRSHVIARLH